MVIFLLINTGLMKSLLTRTEVRVNCTQQWRMNSGFNLCARRCFHAGSTPATPAHSRAGIGGMPAVSEWGLGGPCHSGANATSWENTGANSAHAARCRTQNKPQCFQQPPAGSQTLCMLCKQSAGLPTRAAVRGQPNTSPPDVDQALA